MNCILFYALYFILCILCIVFFSFKSMNCIVCIVLYASHSKIIGWSQDDTYFWIVFFLLLLPKSDVWRVTARKSMC